MKNWVEHENSCLDKAKDDIEFFMERANTFWKQDFSMDNVRSLWHSLNVTGGSIELKFDDLSTLVHDIGVFFAFVMFHTSDIKLGYVGYSRDNLIDVVGEVLKHVADHQINPTKDLFTKNYTRLLKLNNGSCIRSCDYEQTKSSIRGFTFNMFVFKGGKHLFEKEHQCLAPCVDALRCMEPSKTNKIIYIRL